MEKNIVIINGTGGCGKDTFVNNVSKYTSTVNFSSVDKVKEVAAIIGWDGGKTDKDRKFLSDLKKLTTDYNDMSFSDIIRVVNKFRDSDNELLFIHIREPEEISRAVEYFGASTLLIKRQGHGDITSNSSDASVENYDYDCVLEISDLDDSDKKAKIFVEELIQKNKPIEKTMGSLHPQI